MNIPMELQSATRTQQATFAADPAVPGEPDPAVAQVVLTWNTWLDMGRPLAITIDINPIEEDQ